MTVRYEQFEAEADRLKVSFNQIKCGRLRQPIKMDTTEQSLEGVCSLNDKGCIYEYPLVECKFEKDYMHKYRNI